MEKVSREQKSSYQRTFYVAVDGTEFDNPDSCERHESFLKVGEIEHKETSLYPIFGEFYFAKNQDTLNHLIKYHFNRIDMTLNGKKLKVGDWITCHYEYDSNGPDSYYVTTLEEIKEELNKL